MKFNSLFRSNKYRSPVYTTPWRMRPKLNSTTTLDSIGNTKSKSKNKIQQKRQLRKNANARKSLFRQITVEQVANEKLITKENYSQIKSSIKINYLEKFTNERCHKSKTRHNATLIELISLGFAKKHIRLLGRGSFGIVVCVKQGKSKQTAIKISPNPKYENFGEINALNLAHENVIRTWRVCQVTADDLNSIDYDSLNKFFNLFNLSRKRFLENGAQIVFMENVGQRSLQNLIDDENFSISTFNRYNFILQVITAIEYCHSMNVIHLDLKPSNIMIINEHQCKLIDFGSSQLAFIDQQETGFNYIDNNNNNCWKNTNCNPRVGCSGTGNRKNYIEKNVNDLIKSGIGTISYTAPEIFKGEQISKKSDIYSLSIIMWQLMSRQMPYFNYELDSIIYQVVSRNLRPTLTSDMLNEDFDYCQITAACWTCDVVQRPNASQVRASLLQRAFQLKFCF